MNKKVLNKKLNIAKKKIVAIATWCWATLPRKIISCLVITGILLSSIWLLLLKPKPVEASWWDEDWLYRRSVTVTNNTTAETDVYISFDGTGGRPFIDTLVDTLDSNKFQADCGDLRFTKKDGTQLDYYIVSGCGTDETTVHVKLDTFQAGAQTIYFYYGNPSADNGFIGTDFSIVASAYSIGAISSEETGLGPVLWLKFDEGYGVLAYNSTPNDAGKLPGLELDTSHPLANGLVGLWLINENTGSSLADLSGNENDGTGTLNWVLGKFGSALYFDGSSDYVQIADDSSLDVGNSNCTIEAWVYSYELTGDTQIIFQKYGSDIDNIFGFGISSLGEGFFFLRDTSGNGIAVKYLSVDLTGAWHHLVGVREGNYTKIYVDGVLRNTEDISTLGTINTSNHNARIGMNAHYTGADEFKGIIDNVMIYNRDLSTTEIEQLYAEPFAMISDTGASRITGGASWTNSGKFDKALDFDGTDGVVTVIQDANVNLQNKDAYSISTWIYPNSSGESDVNGGQFISKGANTYIRVANEGTDGYLDLEAKLDLTDGNDPTLSIGNAVRVNRWSHILLVWENDGDDEFTIYVNGIDMGTSSGGSGDPADDSGNDLLIGGDTDVHFDGVIDEVIIYPYARDAVQVKRSYNKGASARIGRDDSWLTDGLVGYWKMNETSWSGVANEVVDSSGAGNHGVRGGGATTTNTAKFGKAGTFGGSGDYVDFGTNSITRKVSVITSSLWIYVNSLPADYAGLIAFSKSGTPPQTSSRFQLSVYNTGYIKCGGRSTDTGGWSERNTDTGLISTGQWYYITCVSDYAGNSIKIYIDGVQKDTTGTVSFGNSITDDTDSANGVISGEDDGGSKNFNGSIDDVRIYNRVLSGFEVQRFYDWGPPPIAHWTFDEGSGSSANDSSENANTGIISGTTWKSAAECKYGNCLSFNGTLVDYINLSTLEGSIEDNDTGTISAWIKRSAYGAAWNQIFMHTDMADNDRYLLFGTDGSGHLGFQWRFDTGAWGDNFLSVKGTTILSLDTWYHVTVTSDGTAYKLYVNGLVETLTVDGTNNGKWFADLEPDNYSDFIGKWDRSSGPAQFFDGSIDDVKIYNYALTQKQIVEDMMGGRPAITETTSSPGATVGYWKFDEGYGTTAQDSSGHDNDLTHYTEAYTMSGKFGKAWDGDGTKWLADDADDPDFDFTGTEDFSISGWFKHSPISSSDDYIIAKHDSEGGYKIYMDSDGDIAFAIDDDGAWSPGDIIGNDQTRNYDDNAWHYFSAVKRGTSSMRLYVDGREIDNDTSLTETGSLANGAKLYVGVDSDETDAFDGELDEIKIYRFALSPEEILLDYNKGKSVIMGAVGTELQGAADQKPTFGTSGSQLNTDHPLADGLVGLWLMNEDTGTSIADLSGNGNTGTFGAGAASPSWILGKYGSALGFATDDYVDIGGAMPSGAYTKTAWVNRAADSETYNNNILSGSNDPDDHAFWFPTTYSYYLSAGHNNVWNQVQDNVALSIGAWYFVAVTFDPGVGSGTMILYKDAVEVDRATSIATHQANAQSYIGSYGAPCCYMNGTIDHVMLYDRALSTEEIKWLYAEPFAMLNLPTVPSYSQNRAYCPPGHVGLCNPPIGEWKMDERADGTCTGGTNDVCDTSANTNDGAINGNPVWKGAADCKYGNCLEFDGTEDYIEVVDNPSLDSIITGITFSNWVYRKTNQSGWINILNRQLGSGNFEHYAFAFADNNYSFNGETDGGAFVLTTTEVAPNNVWIHIAGTYNGSLVKLYVNGEEIDSVGHTGDFTADISSLYIGAQRNTATMTGFFNGRIDDIKIFDYALSQEQIAWLYNKGKPIGHWKLDEGEGDTAYDSSGNDNHGDFAGDPTWTTSGKFNSCLDFDGASDAVDTNSSLLLNDFSITAWVYANYLDPADYHGIVSQYGWNNPGCGGGCGRFYYGVYQESFSFRIHGTQVEGSTINTGQWYMLAITRNGSDVTLYKDGVFDFSSTEGTAIYPLQTTRIGDVGPNSLEWNGTIDEVKIYNYALTAQQIKLDYNQGSALRFGD